MSESLRYTGFGAPARTRTRTLFAQTMGFVAVTAALFALGAYLGRHLAYGAGFAAFIAAFACLIGMRFAARRSPRLTVGLLLGAAGPDRVRHRADLRAHPARFAHLLGARPGDLRRLHHVRFPAAPPFDRHRLCTVPGRLHLPGRAERLPVLPADLLQLGTRLSGASRPRASRPASERRVLEPVAEQCLLAEDFDGGIGGRQAAGQDEQQAGRGPADRDVGLAVAGLDGDAGR